MKIRIMHVVSQWGTGGMETGVARIANLLSGDFEHVICSIHNPASGPSVLGAELQHLQGKSGWRSLTSFIRKTRPHIVHSRNWGAIEAIVAARFMNVPAVIHSEHGRTLDTILTLPWRQRYFRRFSYQVADELFAVTNELRQYYVRQVGAAAERMTVIENGVDVSTYHPDALTRTAIRERLHVNGQTTVIGCVARLDPIKDHGSLLLASAELLKENCRIHMVIVGDGPERSRLEQMAASIPVLRSHVTFTGQVNNVAAWLSALDIFVLPSLSEGMSNVLLEAMAVGIAPIAAAVGGNPEILDGGASGCLFNPGDVGQLVARLKELMANPERRAAMGHQARARVERRYDLKRMLESYQRLYLGALERNGRHLSPLLPLSSGGKDAMPLPKPMASIGSQTLARTIASLPEGTAA